MEPAFAATTARFCLGTGTEGRPLAALLLALWLIEAAARMGIFVAGYSPFSPHLLLILHFRCNAFTRANGRFPLEYEVEKYGADHLLVLFSGR